MTTKEKIVLSILCIIIAFMVLSGLPAVLLKITFADVDPFIIPLIINFLIIGVVAVAAIKIFDISYKFGFTFNGLSTGFKKYGVAGLLACVLSFVAFFVGLFPFDYTPSIYKILIEGVIYYIGVAFVEEFFVRGLFLNLIENFAQKSQNKTEIAIITSALVFGLGHVPGTISLGLGVAIFKFVMTTGMGLYFGAIYKKTHNLLFSIILHFLIDICALPYCFTQHMRYENISIVILTITYIALGVYVGVLIRLEK